MEQLLYILDLDLQRRDYASTATPTKPLRYRTSFNPPVLTARCKNPQPGEHKHNKEDIGTWKPTTPLRYQQKIMHIYQNSLRKSKSITIHSQQRPTKLFIQIYAIKPWNGQSLLHCHIPTHRSLNNTDLRNSRKTTTTSKTSPCIKWAASTATTATTTTAIPPHSSL